MKDSTTVSPDLTLGNIGLDSLMVVEISQTLQRVYDISMSADEIRALTFAKIDQLSAVNHIADVDNTPTTSAHYELHQLCPTEAVVEMNHVHTEAAPLFVVHGIDGSVFLLSSVMSMVRSAKVYGIQCTSDTPLTSVPDLARHYIKVLAYFSLWFCQVKLDFI